MQSKAFDGGRSTMKSIETKDHGRLGQVMAAIVHKADVGGS